MDHYLQRLVVTRLAMLRHALASHAVFTCGGQLTRLIVGGSLRVPLLTLFQGVAHKLLAGLQVRMDLGGLDVIARGSTRANHTDQHEAEGSHEADIQKLVECSRHA
jgi:hypothetical protein